MYIYMRSYVILYRIVSHYAVLLNVILDPNFLNASFGSTSTQSSTSKALPLDLVHSMPLDVSEEVTLPTGAGSVTAKVSKVKSPEG